MTAPLHKRLKRDLRSRFLQGVIRVLGLLPLRAALALGSAVAFLGWHLARGTRRAMLANLAIAFPERPLAEREAIARRCFRHLSWLAAEVVALRDLSRRLESYVSFAEGAEARLRAASAQGKGIVFITGHVGNWELMAQRVGRAGIPNATIAKATHDPRMNAHMERIRAAAGVGTLWREDPATGRAMIRTFRDGKALGLLIDQDTRVQGIFVPFFGRPAWTPRAAGDFALRFKAPVIVVWARRRGPRPMDGHEVHVEDLPYDEAPADREAESVAITARATALLEAAIRRTPEEWVWMHDRWHTRPGSHPEASSVPKSADLSKG